MADEIRMNMSITVRNDTYAFDKTILKSNKTFDQTGIGGPAPGRVSVPAADTVIDTTMFTTPGLICITNHDATNYVEFGPTSAAAIVPFMKLEPGMSCAFYLAAGVTLRGRADTAACICSVDACEA